MKIHSEDAYHLLYRLGATANYTGFSYLVRALCRGAGASAAGDKMALPGCSKAIRNELEGSGAGYPYRGPCDLEFKPAAFGDSGPPGTLPKAVYGATARNPACQPVAVRF